MARNNDVFKVLVTKNNLAVLPADQKITALAPGQIGIFNPRTNLSITTGATKEFFLAVGLDTNGDGTTDDVAKSAGTNAQKEGIKFYSFRAHSAARAMKVLLSNYTAKCDTEYGVKLEMRNQEIYATQGYNQFTKTYSIKTSCCVGCVPTCPSGDANEITRLLLVNINNDSSKLIKGRALARTALTTAQTGGTAISQGGVVTDAQITSMMAYNATQTTPATYVYTDVEIETIPLALANFSGSINMNYKYPRQTVIIASAVMGFACNGKVTTTQQAAFEEGAGYDVKQLEYEAKGVSESNYRVSALLGVANDRAFNAQVTTNYDQFYLTYDNVNQGAWLQYTNNLATLIAVPATDTVTRASLAAVLDTLTVPLGFNALVDDIALSNVDPTVVEATQDDTVFTDGIA